MVTGHSSPYAAIDRLTLQQLGCSSADGADRVVRRFLACGVATQRLCAIEEGQNWTDTSQGADNAAKEGMVPLEVQIKNN